MNTPFQQFEINIESAKSYVKSYKELRSYKALGLRGALTQENQYLMWLPRASVVMSLSALDAYVHQVIFDQIPKILKSQQNNISQKLFELTSNIFANPKDFKGCKEYYHSILNSSHPHIEITNLVKPNLLQYSYQRPEKILEAYKLINYENIFSDVSSIWQGDKTNEKDIKDKLEAYCKRRNQIAHEGDLEHTSSKPKPITFVFADNCIDFIENLVKRLDKIIYKV